MTLAARTWAAFAAVTLAGGTARAAEPLELQAPAAPQVLPPVAPPAAPSATPPPNVPANALANNNNPVPPQGNADIERYNLPGVFGDFPGGGGTRGPLPVRIAPDGRFIGFAPTLLLANGSRLSLAGKPSRADELLFVNNPIAPANTPGGRTVGFLPPPGTTLSPEQADLVARIPQVSRGAFKITENESARPTTRIYTTYNYYDDLFKSYGSGVPRVGLHQEVFGYEQATSDRLFSIGFRLPYNQIVSPGFYNRTALGDLTIIAKAVIAQNAETGDLLSGGLVVTVPTGASPLADTINGQSIHPTLLQPYLGFIRVRGDWFAQGFTSLVVPTDSSDVTFFAFDIALGNVLYKNPGAFVSAIIPVVELHLITPLNHRDSRTDDVSLPDTLTILGGAHFNLRERSTLGLAVGTPVTGLRPFSVQATLQFNMRF